MNNQMCRRLSRAINRTLVFAVALGMIDAYQIETAPPEDTIKRIVWRERDLLKQIGSFLFEVYLERQNDLGDVVSDFQKFGRGSLTLNGFVVSEFVPQSRLSAFKKGNDKSPFSAAGFVQLMVPDTAGIDPARYLWEYKGRELLGDVRCWMFDLTPKEKTSYGSFIGRIYVSQSDLAVVRFDGTYTHDPKRISPYLHFVSSRLKTDPRSPWLPASVYVEERDLKRPIERTKRLRARVTFWGYQTSDHSGTTWSSMRIPKGQAATVTGAASENPESHDWYVQIEHRVISWLEAIGLLAPPGPADEVVEGVLQNLLAASKISHRWPIHARVVLTTPVETFMIEDTIVISRGALDVAGDEASLALILAPQLAHILLEHHVNTKYGFPDYFSGPQDQVVGTLTFQRTPKEIDEADPIALELLAGSRYKSKLLNCALFFHAVSESCSHKPALFEPLFGNRVAGCSPATPLFRLEDLLTAASLKQATVLPLGSRVNVDPVSGAIQLVDPLQEKGPFELIPLIPVPKQIEEQTEGDVLGPEPRIHYGALPILK